MDGINNFNGPAILCMQGFHYCDNPLSIFNYYYGEEGLHVEIYKVHPDGDIMIGDDHKCVCSKLKILERMYFRDIFKLIK